MASAKTIARPFRTRMLSSPRLGFVCLGCRRPASPAATSDSRLSQLTSNVLFTSSSAVPKVAQPSIWSSIIPKALRKSDSQPVQPKPSKSKEWNPASFFIVIFLLIGSQAIRMIALRNDFMNYSRKADAKIELLREVIERLQKGESVDVERMLGTGDETKEREWEEVLKEIEEEDSLWHSRSRKKKAKAAAKAGESPADESTSSSETPNSGIDGSTHFSNAATEETENKSKPRRPDNFY